MDASEKMTLQEFRDWIQSEVKEVNQRIEKGKGTWPNEDYVKDEDWGRLMSKKHTLDDVRYMLTRVGDGR